MKFPRTIRLDTSDIYVFHRAAEAGEWAIPGTFAFLERDLATLDGKEVQAFRSGWLGTVSFAPSSLVEVAEISEEDFAALVERLAQHLLAEYGAPNLELARQAARCEAEDAASLAEHPLRSLLAIEREVKETGEIVERLRLIEPSRATDHARIWEILPDEG